MKTFLRRLGKSLMMYLIIMILIDMSNLPVEMSIFYTLVAFVSFILSTTTENEVKK